MPASLSALEMLLLPWQPQSRAEEPGLNDTETSSKVVQWLLTGDRAVGEWQECFSRCYGLAARTRALERTAPGPARAPSAQ